MNKTLTINLAGMAFTIDEDAFQLLKEYLDELKNYFKSTDAGEEIIADIEARAAEHFSQNISASGIISKSNVEHLVEVMGRANDFGAENAKPEAVKRGEEIKRRLYRDGENKVLGGVSSGLAAYFDVDPIIFRIAFVATTIFMGGFGILAYIILYLAMPEAITATEKLQMRGGSMNLQSLKKDMGSDLKAVAKNGRSIVSKMIALFNSVLIQAGAIIRPLVRFVVVSACALVILVATAVLFLSTLSLAGLLFSPDFQAIGFPLTVVVSGWQYYTLSILLYLLISIPFIFVVLTAVWIVRQKKAVRFPVAISFASLWLAALFAVSFIGVKYGANYVSAISSLPEYKKIEKTVQIGEFASIEATGVDVLFLKQAPTSSVKISGTRGDVAGVKISNENGVLKISHSREKNRCLFCNPLKQADIIIEAPDFKQIVARDSVYVFSQNTLKTQTLELDLRGNSGASVDVDVEQLVLNQKDRSRVELIGRAGEMKAKQTQFADLMSGLLDAGKVEVVQWDNANAIVNANTYLNYQGSGDSYLGYTGEATVSSTVKDNAQIFQNKNH